MKVTFKHQGEHLASARYRTIIPSRELAKLGVGQGSDWLIIGKHNWKWEDQVQGFKKERVEKAYWTALLLRDLRQLLEHRGA